MAEKHGTQDGWWTPTKLLVVATLAAILLLVIWSLIVIASPSVAWWGPFGDSFAPIVGLFSSVVLAAALASLSLQRQELALQRKELKLTRKEMKDQRAELKKQAKAQEDANQLAETANRHALLELQGRALQLSMDVERFVADIHTRQAVSAVEEARIAGDGRASTSQGLQNMIRQEREQLAHSLQAVKVVAKRVTELGKSVEAVSATVVSPLVVSDPDA